MNLPGSAPTAPTPSLPPTTLGNHQLVEAAADPVAAAAAVPYTRDSGC